MIAEIANHLWQSTVFALAAALLAIACRTNQARVRYWLWFSASVKFLVPFALLIALGSQLKWASTAQQIATPAVSAAVVHATQPFVDWSPATESLAAPTPGLPEWLLIALAAVWMSGTLAIALIRFRLWRRVRAIVRASTPHDVPGVPRGVDVRSAPAVMEPGVVGVWRPILLVPEGIEDHLTPPQLDAVLVHELCHVRRRDNLTAAVHMLVEAVFWFHPLVWWIGARLVEERERACDEEVLRRGGDPQAYAQGILNVCRRYAKAPLACVSGVSGSDLRRRLESIILGTPGRPLTVGKRLVLSGIATAVFTLPLMAGALQIPVSPGEAVDQDLRFEVASIKPHDASSGVVLMRALPGRFEAINVPVRQLLPQALLNPEDRILPDARIIGAPDWVDRERYTIHATLPDGAPQTGMSVMLGNLLKDRFALATHTETRELPVFHLVLARSDRRLGPNMKESSAECQAMIASSRGGPGGAEMRPAPLPGTPGGPPLFDPVTKPCGSGRSGPGILGGGGYPISWLVEKLSELTRRPVIDKTGLDGLYDFALTFASEPGMYRIPGGMPLPPVPPSTADRDAPGLSSALQEQLGLRLEGQRGSVEVVVIDQLERPALD